MTAPVPAGPTDAQAELREEIADAMAVELESLGISGEVSCRASDYLADAVLALPAARAALDAQETVESRAYAEGAADALYGATAELMDHETVSVAYLRAESVRIRRELDRA